MARTVPSDRAGRPACVQDLGALVELKLRKAFGENRLDLIQRMRFQEIQDHRIADDELAVDRFRMAGEAFGQHVQIDVGRGGDDGEAHEIFAAASSAAGNLLHLADRQVREVARFANAGLRDDDGSRRKSTPAASVVVAKTASRQP